MDFFYFLKEFKLINFNIKLFNIEYSGFGVLYLNLLFLIGFIFIFIFFSLNIFLVKLY